LFAQESEKTIISGNVTDDLTGDPLSFVSVFLKGTTVGTITDASGKYILETDVRATAVYFSFIGYET
jgi:hypothetical protein